MRWSYASPSVVYVERPIGDGAMSPCVLIGGCSGMDPTDQLILRRSGRSDRKATPVPEGSVVAVHGRFGRRNDSAKTLRKREAERWCKRPDRERAGRPGCSLGGADRRRVETVVPDRPGIYRSRRRPRRASRSRRLAVRIGRRPGYAAWNTAVPRRLGLAQGSGKVSTGGQRHATCWSHPHNPRRRSTVRFGSHEHDAGFGLAPGDQGGRQTRS